MPCSGGTQNPSLFARGRCAVTRQTSSMVHTHRVHRISEAECLVEHESGGCDRDVSTRPVCGSRALWDLCVSVRRRYVSVRVVCAWMRSSRAGLTKLQMATQAPPPAKLEVRFFRLAFTSGRALPHSHRHLRRGKRDNNAFSNSCPRPN